VIATGGGAITDEGNLGLIKAESLLICLTAQAETLLARSRGGSKRPLLTGGDKLNNIKELLHKRAEAYNQAHLKVDTEGRSVDQVVEQIIQVIKQSDD
jgi:shikimate kinase